MKKEDYERLGELLSMEQLTEKEFEQLEFLQKASDQAERTKAFRENQRQPYESKVSRAANLAWEFYRNVEVDGKAYVAVGGLDSITLYVFLRSIGIDVPAVSVSSLEDKSIQNVHKALGVQELYPVKDKNGKRYSKVRVIREFGWPVISKEVAGKIHTLQHPTEKNATVRHAIITGETGKQGGWRKGTRMQLKQKWLERFGGADEEGETLGLGRADFDVSDKCCYYLKEKPCEDYRKESGRFPYMGLMASEGGRREKALAINGCNYISPTTKRSCPFATFLRDDILRLALEMDKWYHEHLDMFPGDPVDSIIPEIYGEIVFENGHYRTTKAQRTGCSMCGFGIHMEKRPHRFDQLWNRNQKEWEMWMNHVCQDQDGNWYGWGHVLDYIGVAWREPDKFFERSNPSGGTGQQDHGFQTEGASCALHGVSAEKAGVP